jgi:membrane-bound lytic murein transglycosylase D
MKPADAAKRVGMTEAELRSVNNVPPRVVIKAGSSLLVPRSKHLETDVGAHAADNGQLSLAPEVLLKRTVLKAGKKDSVASLAKRYRVSPDSVAEWNKVSASAAFKAGQQIVLFLPAQAKTLTRSKGNRTSRPVQQARQKSVKATRVAKQ